MELYIPFFRSDQYDEFKDIKSWKVVDPIRKIRTGDIFMFSASGILSTGIKALSGSIWNHSGIVCWLEIELNTGNTIIDLYCFELGSQYYSDLITRKLVDKGTRLVRFSDISTMYDIVAVRNINLDRSKEFAPVFHDFMMEWKEVGFPSFSELTPIYLFGSSSKPNFKPDKVTCSQLIVIMLNKFGIINVDFDPSETMPYHFSYKYNKLPKDAFLGKEFIVYTDRTWFNPRLTFILSILIFILLLILLRQRFLR